MALEQMASENPSQMYHHIQFIITKVLVFITTIKVYKWLIGNNI